MPSAITNLQSNYECLFQGVAHILSRDVAESVNKTIIEGRPQVATGA